MRNVIESPRHPRHRGRLLPALAAGALLTVLPPGVPAARAGEPPPGLLAIMAEELGRSMAALRAKGDPPPYFALYEVKECRKTRLEASVGALRDRGVERHRHLGVQVRVGDPALDSTHRLRRDERDGSDEGDDRYLPLDDDPAAIRSVLWIETDRAYKRAAERFVKVQTDRAVAPDEEDRSPDFSAADPARAAEPVPTPVRDLERWKEALRAASAVFRDYPDIQRSEVSLMLDDGVRYLVTSEGTALELPAASAELTVRARAKAADGMDLDRSESFELRSEDGLPDREALVAAAKAVAEDLTALRRAPVIEPYSGPAMLSGRAAAVFFHEVFGHRLEGHRQKDDREGQTFTRKLGTAVLPESVSIHDDPTLETYRGAPLNGFYRFDNEGVPAQRVTLVEGGILKGFLLSRSPAAGFERSNGHGRGSVGRQAVARQGNLIVEASGGLAEAQLRERLVEECRREGKPYGLYFKDIVGGRTYTGRDDAQAYLVSPVMVYRVFADRRPDELVRGANLIGTPLLALNAILAFGSETGVFNGSCGAESGWVSVAAVAPAFVTAKVEVQKKEVSATPPPVLAPAPAGAAAPPAADAIGEDVLLRAMRDELARSMASLRIEGMEPPYFIEYDVEERRETKLTAVLGALEKREAGGGRRLRVGVRVGGRELDNTGFVSDLSFYGLGGSSHELASDDDYDALRRDLWLATDDAYRRALAQLAAKRAALKTRQREELPDLSEEKPTTLLLPATSGEVDEPLWERRVRELSSVFRELPQIQESGASLRVTRIVRRYVNSEGTAVRRPADMALLLVGGTTQAADGMALGDVVPLFQGALADLPPQEALLAQARASAERVRTEAAAPLAERYSGPALLTPPAAAELAALLLLPAFSGERALLFGDERLSSFFRPGAFSGRIGRRVLPEILSVEDDPLRAELDGRPLFGGYAVDDQGVPARRVSLVEKGVLRGLLMSRRPGFGIAASNGHGRSAGGALPRAMPGNLIVTAEGGRSFEELKHELLERCRAEGLEHGLVIESVGLPPASELKSSLIAMMMGGESGLKVSVTARRVFAADGREEPVRGLVTGAFSPRALLEIEAAGKERHVLNLLGADDGSVMGPVRTFALSSTDESSAGVPVSVAAPALLFREIELAPSEAPRGRLPLAPPPPAP